MLLLLLLILFVDDNSVLGSRTICREGSCDIPSKPWLPAGLTLEPLFSPGLTADTFQALFAIHRTEAQECVDRLAVVGIITLDDLSDMSVSEIEQLGLTVVLERRLTTIVSTRMSPKEYLYASPDRKELCNPENSRSLFKTARCKRTPGTAIGEYFMLLYDTLRRAKRFCKHGLTILQAAQLHRDLHLVQEGGNTFLSSLDDTQCAAFDDSKPTVEVEHDALKKQDGWIENNDAKTAKAANTFGDLNAAKILLSYDHRAGPHHRLEECKEATKEPMGKGPSLEDAHGIDNGATSRVARCWFTASTSVS